MLLQLTVRSVNFKNVTAYTEAFDSEKIQMLRNNQNTAGVPILAGTAEFIYINDDGRDTFYTVTESVAAITTSAAGAGFPSNYGTAGTGVVATEYGNGLYHQTVLTYASFTKDIAAAALAHGKAGYTFPVGGIHIHGGTIDATITGATSVATPDIGIGTVIGSGAVAVLGGTGTFEDICDGLAGTAIAPAGGQTARVFRAEIDATSLDGHTNAIPVFFNFAFLWIVTETLTIYPCIITLNWTFLGDV